jgi:hypothetical protein
MERGPLEGFELRIVRLGAMAHQLGTPAASIDAVQAAAALADTRRCPLCQSHPRDGTRVAVRRVRR